MSKFHYSLNGAMPCSAQPGACPISDKHFPTAEAAELAFGDTLSTFSDPVEGEMRSMAGGRYYAIEVEKTDALLSMLEKFEEKLGDSAKTFSLNKARRDRGFVYHLTVVSPQELKENPHLSPPVSLEKTARLIGLGKAENETDEAWFVVCQSHDIDNWREANGLPKKDLHITVGFAGKEGLSGKDVHNVSKGAESLVRAFNHR